jgi:hypothetical protein
MLTFLCGVENVVADPKSIRHSLWSLIVRVRVVVKTGKKVKRREHATRQPHHQYGVFNMHTYLLTFKSGSLLFVLSIP